mgnify:FL=1
MRDLTEEELQKGGKDPELLKRFMKEFFPYSILRKAGLFTKEMRGDYYAQAVRVCNQMGLSTIYEYGSQEIRCHLTYMEGKRPEGEGFITVIPSIYE